MTPDWLKDPPQIVGRAYAHRLRTDALLRFNVQRLMTGQVPSKEFGIKAVGDFVDACTLLHVMDAMNL